MLLASFTIANIFYSAFRDISVSDIGTALDDSSQMQRVNCPVVPDALGADIADTALDTSRSPAQREMIRNQTTSQFTYKKILP